MKKVINGSLDNGNYLTTNLAEEIERLQELYVYIGIRYENLLRNIGDTCSNSRHISGDECREFPEYDSDDYNELPELDGTSVWLPDSVDFDALSDGYCDFAHCYIVGGDDKGQHDNPDDGEILIRDAEVLAIIF